jgi:hypothetical protein
MAGPYCHAFLQRIKRHLPQKTVLRSCRIKDLYPELKGNACLARKSRAEQQGAISPHIPLRYAPNWPR